MAARRASARTSSVTNAFSPDGAPTIYSARHADVHRLRVRGLPRFRLLPEVRAPPTKDVPLLWHVVARRLRLLPPLRHEPGRPAPRSRAGLLPTARGREGRCS